MSVSIVMPSFNEEKNIAKTIEDFYREISSVTKNFEFIVIDSSSDGSLTILNELANKIPELKIIHTPPEGHGKALLRGYELAKKTHIFQTDSDSQFEPEDFHKLYNQKDKYDFILGIRHKRYDPFLRLILTKIIQITLFLLFAIWIKDANCPFRLIKRTLLLEILKKMPENTTAPNIFITLQVLRKKTNILEIPVTHLKRKSGHSISGIKLAKTAFCGFLELLKWRFKT